MASAPKVFIVSFDKSGKRVAVVDYVKCEVYEARVVYPRKDEDHIISLEPDWILIYGCPKSIEVVANDSKGTRYNVVWNVPWLPHELIYEGFTAREVFAYLRASGLTLRKTVSRRVVEALLPALAGVI